MMITKMLVLEADKPDLKKNFDNLRIGPVLLKEKNLLLHDNLK